MKFKVAPKDFMMFILFCLFLFYLCAIGVLNFSSFAKTGEFYGLNPFMAFNSEYIGGTVVLFLIVLIIIFSSVSSYIFSREKGKGFGLDFGEKSEKGYNRWATEKEMKTDKNVERINPIENETNVAGIPLINNGKEIFVDNGEYHNLVIGATGSGKTETIVKPMVNILAKKGESMIIMDPKGEIYKYSANYLESRGYKIRVLNFRDPANGNAWNPLTLPYQYLKSGNSDKSTELLDDVALNILYDPNNKGEPFWEKSAADYFSGICLGLFEDAKEEEININSVSLMGTVGEEKFAASNFAKEYFSLKGESSSSYIFASGTINAPAETKGGILSVFRQKIRGFASRENLSEMLAYSDFDMRDIGKEKTAIFIIIHDEKTTYHGLATIFIKQCYETLIDEAQKNGGKLPFRTNFILDEFANMPPLKDVDAMVTAARSRDIRFTFIIQNFGQLKDIYGEKAGTIKGNCGNLIYLISTELASLEEISKMAGEVKSGEKDKTASTPLISVTDLQKLKLFEAIIFRWRKSPFRTKYKPDFEMNWGIDRKMAETIPREIKKVALFDLKEYVKEEKRKKLFETLENNPNGLPQNQPMPMPPFPGMPPMGSSMTNPMNNPMPNPLGGPGAPSSFDIDAMIKSIDAKIAELDAEEERRKKEVEDKKIATETTKIEEKTETKKEETQPKSQQIEDTMELPLEKEEPKKDIKLDLEIKEEKTPLKAEKKPTSNIETPSKTTEEKVTVEKQKKENKEIELSIKPQAEVKEAKAEENKPKINVDVDSFIVDNNTITDDEFFDDFFGDD